MALKVMRFRCAIGGKDNISNDYFPLTQGRQESKYFSFISAEESLQGKSLSVAPDT
jgi:hypothetical protein